MVADYNPHIAGFCNPVYSPKQPGFFHGSIVLVRVFEQQFQGTNKMVHGRSDFQEKFFDFDV